MNSKRIDRSIKIICRKCGRDVTRCDLFGRCVGHILDNATPELLAALKILRGEAE